jgi:hypothetical protein
VYVRVLAITILCMKCTSVHVFVRACLWFYACVRAGVCTCTRVRVRERACMYVGVFACAPVHTSVCACICVCVRACVRACGGACMHMCVSESVHVPFLFLHHLRPGNHACSHELKLLLTVWNSPLHHGQVREHC